MTHNDVAPARSLPARSIEPRALSRRLSCEGAGSPAATTLRTLVHDLEPRALVRVAEGGR
jgi:hypothetical protein